MIDYRGAMMNGTHIYQGDCPDTNNGPYSRDNNCPACRALILAEENTMPIEIKTRNPTLLQALKAGAVITWNVKHARGSQERFLLGGDGHDLRVFIDHRDSNLSMWQPFGNEKYPLTADGLEQALGEVVTFSHIPF